MGPRKGAVFRAVGGNTNLTNVPERRGGWARKGGGFEPVKLSQKIKAVTKWKGRGKQKLLRLLNWSRVPCWRKHVPGWKKKKWGDIKLRPCSGESIPNPTRTGNSISIFTTGGEIYVRGGP